jgi:hypothetical protein
MAYFGACLLVISFLSSAAMASAAERMTPEKFIDRFDSNGDGVVSEPEYTGKRRSFGFFDGDGDGIATQDEIEAAFSGRTGGSQRVRSGTAGRDRVPLNVIDPETRCGIGRSGNCDIAVAIRRGLFPTGLRPQFPDGLGCRDIDEGWAISYTAKRDRENYHGGIDMPAPFGTPMLAVADGTVVSKSADPESYRGIEIILRHTPEETGLPVWTYTQYAHLDEMPSIEVGARVRMGQNLGPTGNSGFQRNARPGKERRPAIHFAVWFSDKPGYAIDNNDVIPVDGWWMDPNALYRLGPPFDSASLKELTGDQKIVSVPVMLESGKRIPAGTKLIWPYACWK